MVLVDTSIEAGANTGGPHIGVRAGGKGDGSRRVHGALCCALSMVRGGRVVRERCASMDAAANGDGRAA